MVKVLFVCLGNICRSPLAESIFMHKVAALGLHGRFQADSCGTSNYNIGSSSDPRTRRNAAANGIQVNHVARQLSRSDFDEFDSILVMDSHNLEQARSICGPGNSPKVLMLRSFDPMGPGDVPDPYYGGDKGFQEVFDILNRSMDELIAQLAKANH